jgi:hypothetical protein
MKPTPLAAAAVFVAILAGAGSASAQDCNGDPPLVTGDTATVFFDNFVVPAGDTFACPVAVDTGIVPAADTFRAYSADYRGQVTVADGETAALNVELASRTDSVVFVGPLDSDPTVPFYRNYVAANLAGVLASTVQLDFSNASDPFSGGALDTIDYALAAVVTRDEVRASLDRAAASRTAAALHLDATADLVRGGAHPLFRSDGLGLVGAVGSGLLGGNGRFEVAPGFVLNGGVALFEQEAGGATVAGALGSASLYVVAPEEMAVRPFAGIGVTLAPGEFGFARHYDDGDVPGDLTPDGGMGWGSASGLYAALFAEAGVLFAPTVSDQLAFSATLGHGLLDLQGYDEAIGDGNVFAASFAEQSLGFDTLKLGAAWTTALGNGLTLTLNAAAGQVLARDELVADVAFVGTETGMAADDSFVQYGASLGFQPAPGMNADLFVQGTTGSASGTHVFVGGALKQQF